MWFFVPMMSLLACGRADGDGGNGPTFPDEPDVLSVLSGSPASTGAWEGGVSYGGGRIFSVRDGAIEAPSDIGLGASAWFTEPSLWTFYDVGLSTEAGCWTGAFLSTATGNLDVGATVSLGVGTSEILLERDDGGVIAYSWDTAETPDWEPEPGGELSFDGVTTADLVPEEVELTDLQTSWADYVAGGTLDLAWVAPTLPGSRMMLYRYEADGGFTWCVFGDDGAVSIELGGPPSEEQQRVVVLRAFVEDTDTDDYGRVWISSFDQTSILPR